MPGDPLHTRVCDMFGVEFPIFAFTHCKDVAAAVTNAGGIGVLGMGAHAPEEITKEIAWLRDRCGDKPFGIDLVFPASVPEMAVPREQQEAQIPVEVTRFVQGWMEKNGVRPFIQAELDAARPGRPRGGGGFSSREEGMRQVTAALEARPPLLVAGLGSPAAILDAAHERGIKVGGLIGRVRQARREIEAGVDLIMAQGYDGGGHTGEIGTFTLVPQVLDIAGDTPVIAAGGVGTGRHLAAAVAMGAAGVWCGSLWLASRESDADIAIKEKIIAATEEDTLRSKSWSGKPQRGLKCEWNLAWEAPEAPKPLPMPLQGIVAAAAAAATIQTKSMAHVYSPAGQVIGSIREMKACRDIVFDMVADARDRLEALTS